MIFRRSERTSPYSASRSASLATSLALILQGGEFRRHLGPGGGFLDVGQRPPREPQRRIERPVVEILRLGVRHWAPGRQEPDAGREDLKLGDRGPPPSPVFGQRPKLHVTPPRLRRQRNRVPPGGMEERVPLATGGPKSWSPALTKNS